MDVAMNLHKRILEFGYQGPKVHHLCVDEVQDLSQVEASLLMMLADRRFLVFVGDSCQTVSAETDFRFCDLRSCLFRNSGEPLGSGLGRRGRRFDGIEWHRPPESGQFDG